MSVQLGRCSRLDLTAVEFADGNESKVRLPQYDTDLPNCCSTSPPAPQSLAKWTGSTIPAPVGMFEPNGFGLYDVLGNVSEWTQDCWNESYSGAPADGSAWSSGDCSRRVLRGGGWRREPRELRSAFRSRLSAAGHNNLTGLRVARTIN